MSDFPFEPGQVLSPEDINSALGIPLEFLEQDEYRVSWQDENGNWQWGESDE